MFDVRIIYIMFHYMHDLEHNIYYANMDRYSLPYIRFIKKTDNIDKTSANRKLFIK